MFAVNVINLFVCVDQYHLHKQNLSFKVAMTFTIFCHQSSPILITIFLNSIFASPTLNEALMGYAFYII